MLYLAIGFAPGVAAFQSIYQVAIDATVSGVVMLFAVAPTVPGAEGSVADEPLPEEPLPEEPVPEEPEVVPPEEPLEVFEPLPTPELLLEEAAAPAVELVPPLPPQADNATTIAVTASVRNCQTMLELATLLPRACP